MNRSPNRVKKFYHQYQHTHQLSPPRRRPPIIDELIEEGIIGSVESYPKQTLNEIANDITTSPSKVKGILDDHKIQYFEQTAVVGLDEAHKNQRIQFCSQFNNIRYSNFS